MRPGITPGTPLKVLNPNRTVISNLKTGYVLDFADATYRWGWGFKRKYYISMQEQEEMVHADVERCRP
jgi:hypothetical protein